MAPLKEPNVIILELVIGVPRAPQDPYTDEPELQTINLLNVSGFAVKLPDGWVPQLPSMKNGGLWADSALAPGRQLIAGEFANVTETMTLTATGATMEQRLFLKSRLWEFARRAKAYHTNWSEQQPVYIKWHALSAPCAQYALIYNIDGAVENDAFDIDTDTVVITIEREPAWRYHVPPGGNPIEWTYFVRNFQRGTDYQYDDMALDSTASLVTGTVNNRHEWTYNAGNPVVTPTSKNYVEIPADRIPGDAPALVCAALHFTPPDAGVAALRRVLMWLSSKELSGVDQVAGTAMASGYIMNACDMGGAGATPTAGSARTAVFNTAAVPARQFMSMVLVSAGSVVELTSGDASSTTFSFWYRQFMRGRFAVFVRATALTGVATDIRLTVKVEEWNFQNVPLDGSQAQIVLPTVNVPVGGAGEYSLIYAGQVNIPFEAKSHVGIDGRGLYLKKFVNNVTPIDLRFKFRFENFTSPTASRTAHMLDAILVPMDEGFAEFRNSDTTSTGNSQTHVMDNTGYLARGKPDDISVRTVNNGSFSVIHPATVLEQRGNMPVLLPRTTQRLYFLNSGGFGGGGGSTSSVPDADMSVFINIVPRCYGVAAL